jgi:hypothetical protein
MWLGPEVQIMLRPPLKKIKGQERQLRAVSRLTAARRGSRSKSGKADTHARRSNLPFSVAGDTTESEIPILSGSQPGGTEGRSSGRAPSKPPPRPCQMILGRALFVVNNQR